MSAKYVKSICYLCGQPGADSKDHLPPKSLLPPGSNSFQRITLPAHKECNSGASADEEYVRDLIVPEAIQFGFQNAQSAYEKVWRGWSRDQGWTRYQRFLKKHVVVELRTPEGLYAGQGIGITPDKVRITRIGNKIVRGLIFHDSGAVVPESDIVVAPLCTRDIPSIKKSDSSEPYWRALSNDSCLHTMCGESAAMRRIYIGHSGSKGILLECHFAVMLWTLYFAASTVIPLYSATKKGFAFSIDQTSGEWIRDTSETVQ